MVLALALPCLAASSCRGTREARDRPESAQLKPFRTVAYATTFGQRFNLPANGASSMASGVQAIVVRITPEGPASATCAVDLYLSDEIDFAYPEGTEGSLAEFRLGKSGALGFYVAAFGDDSKLTPREQRFLEPRAVFRSSSRTITAGEGSFDKLPITSFFRGVETGLSIVSFEPLCSVLRANEVEIWLLRSGQAPDRLDPTVQPRPEVAIRVALPQLLLRFSAPALDKAVRAQQAAPVRGVPPDGTPAYTLPTRK